MVIAILTRIETDAKYKVAIIYTIYLNYRFYSIIQNICLEINLLIELKSYKYKDIGLVTILLILVK